MYEWSDSSELFGCSRALLGRGGPSTADTSTGTILSGTGFAADDLLGGAACCSGILMGWEGAMGWEASMGGTACSIMVAGTGAGECTGALAPELAPAGSVAVESASCEALMAWNPDERRWAGSASWASGCGCAGGV